MIVVRELSESDASKKIASVVSSAPRNAKTGQCCRIRREKDHGKHDGKAGAGIDTDRIRAGKGIVHHTLQDHAGTGKSDACKKSAEDAWNAHGL